MPLNGATFYGPKTGRGSETAIIMWRILPGESGTTTYKGVQYKLHHSDTSSGTSYVSQEDKYPITGFKYESGTRNGNSYNNAKFYYTRNSYNIVFMNNGAEDNKTAASISRCFQANYNPTKPASVPGKLYVCRLVR